MLFTWSRSLSATALFTLLLSAASARPQQAPPLWRRILGEGAAVAADDEASSAARQVRRIAQPSSVGGGPNDVAVTPVSTTTAPPTTRKKLVTLAPLGNSIQDILFNSGYRDTPAEAEPEPNNIDDESNLEGLHPKDVWLLDGNLLVLKGGDFAGDEFDDTEPLDDYQAPYREPKFPPRGLYGSSNLPPGVFGQGFTPRGLSLSDLARYSGTTENREKLQLKQPEATAPPSIAEYRPYAPYAEYIPYVQNSPYTPYAQNTPYTRYGQQTQNYSGPSSANVRAPPQHKLPSDGIISDGGTPVVGPTLAALLGVSEESPSTSALPSVSPSPQPTEMDPSLSKKGASITSRHMDFPQEPTAFKGRSSITSRPEPVPQDPAFGKQGSSITSRPKVPVVSVLNPCPEKLHEATKAAVSPVHMFITVTISTPSPTELPEALPTVPSAAPRVSSPRPKHTYSVSKSYSTTTSTSSTSFSGFGHRYLPPPRRARTHSVLVLN